MPPQNGAGSRLAILDAALRVFARGGYDGASMPKIAQLAEVAPPLIHYYFKSKENLWREAVDHSLGQLRTEAGAIVRATRSLAPLDRLRTLLQAYAQFAARCPDHFSMILAEARSDSERFSWLQDNYTGQLFGDVVAILQDARDTGAIRDVNLQDLAVLLIGGMLVHFTVSPAWQDLSDIEQSSAQFVDMVFGLLLKGVTV